MLSWFRAKGLGSGSLASPHGRRKYVHKRTYPPTILSLSFSPYTVICSFYLNKYSIYVLTSVLVLILAIVSGPVLVLAPSRCCHLCSVFSLLSPGPSLASKHGSSSVVACHSFRDLMLKLSGVRATVRKFS
jgi:hypothetical protein